MNGQIRTDSINCLQRLEALESALPELVKLIEEKNQKLTNRVISIIEQYKYKPAIPFLVNRILDGGNIGTMQKCSTAILKLTGQKFYNDVDKFLMWWEDNKEQVLKELEELKNIPKEKAKEE